MGALEDDITEYHRIMTRNKRIAELEAAMLELDRAGIRRVDYIGDTPLELYDRIQILVEERDEARAALTAGKRGET